MSNDMSDFDRLIDRATDAALRPYDRAGIGAGVRDVKVVDAIDLPMEKARRYSVDVDIRVRVHVTQKEGNR